jgi:hypothetical protein
MSSTIEWVRSHHGLYSAGLTRHSPDDAAPDDGEHGRYRRFSQAVADRFHSAPIRSKASGTVVAGWHGHWDYKDCRPRLEVGPFLPFGQ